MMARYGEAGGLRYIGLTYPATPPDAPLVVGLHGRGSSPAYLAALAPALETGWRYAFPEAPLPLDYGPGGARFSWYEPIPTAPAGMTTARERLNACLATLHTRLAVPPARTALVGFSQGAALALDAGLRAPQPYAALVAMSGYLAEGGDLPDALAHASAGQQPLLLVHGRRDPLLSIDLARRAHQLLTAAGLDPTYEEFDMAHEVTATSLAVVRDFLRRHLPG